MSKRVFFFGAGFSKAICSNYPTLVQLTESVNSGFTTRYPSGPLRSHYDSMPSIIKADVEQMLSFLVTEWPWKTSVDEALDRALFHAMAFEVSAAITAIRRQEVDAYVGRFARYVNSTASAVITLNYDTLFEDLSREYVQVKKTRFSDLELIFEDSFDEQRHTSELVPYYVENFDRNAELRSRLFLARDFISTLTVAHVAQIMGQLHASALQAWTAENVLAEVQRQDAYNGTRNYVELIKLHGSVSWTDEQGETLSVIGGLGGKRKVSLPMIVPPIADKSSYYRSAKLRDLWYSAHKALEEADEVIVVGFSLPLTDISVRYLFQSALRDRPQTKVVIINPDTSGTLRNRYEQVFEGDARANVLDWTFWGNPDGLKDFTLCRIPERRLDVA